MTLPMTLTREMYWSLQVLNGFLVRVAKYRIQCI